MLCIGTNRENRRSGMVSPVPKDVAGEICFPFILFLHQKGRKIWTPDTLRNPWISLRFTSATTIRFFNMEDRACYSSERMIVHVCLTWFPMISDFIHQLFHFFPRKKGNQVCFQNFWGLNQQRLQGSTPTGQPTRSAFTV